MPGTFSRVAALWRGQNLATRFLLTSAAVFVVGMSIAGAWIADRIEDGVTQNTAVSTALYFESFVAPLVQELAQGETLPPSRQEALSALVARTPLGQRVVSFKVWRQEGIIVFASRPELIGKKFPVTPKLRRAWAGHLAAGLDDSVAEENKGERAAGRPLLEIYVPIRQENSHRIIAVAEFYERADQLKEDIFNAKIEAGLLLVLLRGLRWRRSSALSTAQAAPSSSSAERSRTGLRNLRACCDRTRNCVSVSSGHRTG